MRFGGGKPLAAPQAREGRGEATDAGCAKARGATVPNRRRAVRPCRIEGARCDPAESKARGATLPNRRRAVRTVRVIAWRARSGAALGAELALAIEFEEAVVHGDV